MIKLIETRSFKDKKKALVKTEKEFSSVKALHKALAKSPLASEVIYRLKKDGVAALLFADGVINLEIKTPIVLTDEHDTTSR